MDAENNMARECGLKRKWVKQKGWKGKKHGWVIILIKKAQSPWSHGRGVRDLI